MKKSGKKFDREAAEASRQKQYNAITDAVDGDPNWVNDDSLAIRQNALHLTLALAVMLGYRYAELRKEFGRRKSRQVMLVELDRYAAHLREAFAEQALLREGAL